MTDRPLTILFWPEAWLQAASWPSRLKEQVALFCLCIRRGHRPKSVCPRWRKATRGRWGMKQNAHSANFNKCVKRLRDVICCVQTRVGPPECSNSFTSPCCKVIFHQFARKAWLLTKSRPFHAGWLGRLPARGFFRWCDLPCANGARGFGLQQQRRERVRKPE